MLKGSIALVVLAILTLFSSMSVQRGCNDARNSALNLAYPPIRDMRRTVALTPQKVSLRAPDSASVPVTGLVVLPTGASGQALIGGDLAARLGETLVNPVPDGDASVARGEHVYKRACVPCHGASLKGDGLVSTSGQFIPATNLLAAPTRARKDGYIFSYIRNGGAVMPSYGALVTAHEAWDVVHYVRHMQRTTPE